MSYASDSHNAPADVKFRAVGMGHHSTWQCMYCKQFRSTTAGSKGKAGPRRKCAQCVAAKK